MDIEQLKLILQTVEATTGNAKDVAVYWLVLEGAKALLDYGIWFGVLYASFKTAEQLVSLIPNRAAELRDMVLPRMAGTHVTAGEISEVKAVILKGLAK